MVSWAQFRNGLGERPNGEVRGQKLCLHGQSFYFDKEKYIFESDRIEQYRTTYKEQINHIIHSFKCKQNNVDIIYYNSDAAWLNLQQTVQ